METSRQLAFINNHLGFTISFINGEQIIEEISKIHNIGPIALDFYKKSILGSTQLINYLKANETLGFYIDSESPYFRFKIELNNSGMLRTLLLPEEFDAPPAKITGQARIFKMIAGGKPYTSILKYDDFPTEEIINDVIVNSYQTNAKVLYSTDFLNSVLITKLPPTNINKKIEDYNETSLEDFLSLKKNFLTELLSGKYTSIEDIGAFCEKEEFKYLGSHEVKFHCPCSKERMITNFSTLRPSDIKDIFSEKDSVETRCDYCNTVYEIHKDDVQKQSLH